MGSCEVGYGKNIHLSDRLEKSAQFNFDIIMHASGHGSLLGFSGSLGLIAIKSEYFMLDSSNGTDCELCKTWWYAYFEHC